MVFKYATKLQRFLTYLIDFTLISIIAGRVGTLIEKACGFDSAATSSYYELIVMEVYNMAGGTGTSENLSYYLQQYFSHNLLDLCFTGGVTLIFIILALVVVPIFWKGQTLGRALTHLTLVDQYGKPATVKRFILREVLGTFLMYSVLGGIMTIISLIILLVKNRSLVDMISGTHLVLNKEYAERLGFGENPANQNMNYDNSYAKEEHPNNIDVDWKEVEPENNNNQEEENNSDDRYKII